MRRRPGRRRRPGATPHPNRASSGPPPGGALSTSVDRSLLAEGRAQEGDLVILVAGSPPGIPGSTNALRVHKMGDAVNGVAPAYEDLNEL